MTLQFKPAVRTQAKLRLALAGVSGSGKTLTALFIAKALGEKIAVCDTEASSSAKYIGDPDVPPFDLLTLDTYSPALYIEVIEAAEQAGYDVLIIDSLSHAWMGKNGVLEQVDMARAKSKTGNTFTDGWRVASPLHQKLMDKILQSRVHVIATIRSKQEYVLEERNGQKVPVKKGMELVQRNDTDYLFDVVGELSVEHTLVITKSRCRALSDQVIPMPGPEIGELLKSWLTTGAPADDTPPAAKPAEAPSRPQTPHAPSGKPATSQGIKIPDGLPCAGFAVSDLRPAQTKMLLERAQQRVNTEGKTWEPLLQALRAHHAQLTGQNPPKEAPPLEDATKKEKLVTEILALAETILPDQRREIMKRAFDVTSTKELRALDYEALERGHVYFQEILEALPRDDEESGDVDDIFPSEIDVTASTPPTLPESAIDDDGEVISAWVTVLERRAAHFGEAAEEKLAKLLDDYPALTRDQWCDFWTVLGRAGVAV